jgi:hypothetical protein
MTMEQRIERFLALSRRYLLEEQDAGPRPERDFGPRGVEVNEMRTMDERQRQVLASRMKQAVANPPQRAFARELLERGMTANEVWQLVMHDPAFVRVPEAFRIAVANAAREMIAEQLLATKKAQAAPRRASPT